MPPRRNGPNSPSLQLLRRFLDAEGQLAEDLAYTLCYRRYITVSTIADVNGVLLLKTDHGFDGGVKIWRRFPGYRQLVGHARRVGLRVLRW